MKNILKTTKDWLPISLMATALLVLIAIFYGWGSCIYKATRCDWKPIGKCELFYTVGSFVPVAGVFIGYFNIEDK